MRSYAFWASTSVRCASITSLPPLFPDKSILRLRIWISSSSFLICSSTEDISNSISTSPLSTALPFPALTDTTLRPSGRLIPFSAAAWIIPSISALFINVLLVMEDTETRAVVKEWEAREMIVHTNMNAKNPIIRYTAMRCTRSSIRGLYFFPEISMAFCCLIFSPICKRIAVSSPIRLIKHNHNDSVCQVRAVCLLFSKTQYKIMITYPVLFTVFQRIAAAIRFHGSFLKYCVF